MPNTVNNTVLVRAIVILAVVTVAAYVATAVLLPDSPATAERIVLYVSGITGVLLMLLKSNQNSAYLATIDAKVDDNTAVTEDAKRDLSEVKQVQVETHALVDGQAHEWRAGLEKIAALEAQLAALMGNAIGREEGRQSAIDLLATNVATPAHIAAPQADGTILVEAPAVIHVVTPEEPQP